MIIRLTNSFPSVETLFPNISFSDLFRGNAIIFLLIQDLTEQNPCTELIIRFNIASFNLRIKHKSGIEKYQKIFSIQIFCKRTALKRNAIFHFSNILKSY